MIAEKKRVLLVEDDQNFGTILRDFLELHDYDVVLARNGVEGNEKFNKNEFSICLLDVMMPYKDGFTLAKEIRKTGSTVPIIFLTAKSMKDDVVKGYNLGADDYLTKPFDSDVLLLKMKAMFQRMEQNAVNLDKAKHLFTIGKFEFNAKLRQLSFDASPPVKLSPKEGSLLQLLALYQNDLMPRELALKKIWKDDTYFTSRSMDVYIAKLRKHLKADPSIVISNIHGEGFRMSVSS
ncbi:MAG: response regulator transcription factor [Bacteroidetes bacterium]|nr:response regulator transcription factor [Bacteroidota bacterium]MDA0888437.1 response regulator transcription factor [Bacteroidota bacterium]MDA1084497.1 response regulator transcription factor [Bacteroidota bacterium]